MSRFLVLLLSLIGGAAVAEISPLSDPTRPAGLAASTANGSPDLGEGGLRLQSVLSPVGGKPTAIISGQVVSVGGKVGDARLVRLSETEAVLKGPKGVEYLILIPDVVKRNEVLKAVATDKRKKP